MAARSPSAAAAIHRFELHAIDHSLSVGGHSGQCSSQYGQHDPARTVGEAIAATGDQEGDGEADGSDDSSW